MSDYSEQFKNRIQEALRESSPVYIRGGGSKSFYGLESGTADDTSVLSTSGHSGIINYEPKELVITARSGTPLSEIQDILAQQQQMLAFEPPHFSELSDKTSTQATLGGTIACGFSGPRRPYTGAARDFVLGCRMINGEAQVLHFGGEVMKNVAGYDVSRLMVGALGTLGLLLDISLKVLPLPEHEQTQVLECSVHDAIAWMNQWAASPLPLSAACYDGAQLYVRLSGAPSAVSTGAKRIGGDILKDAQGFWYNIRELKHGFFNGDKTLWRISVPSDTPAICLPGKQLIDWGGAQRWYIANEDDSASSQEYLYKTIADIGGHATLFRSAAKTRVFQPLPESLMTIQQRLKMAFDPHGLFNPGRIYREL